MANITLQVVVGGLENAQLDGFDEKFYEWLRTAYRGESAPSGTIDDVREDDREEDDEAED